MLVQPRRLESAGSGVYQSVPQHRRLVFIRRFLRTGMNPTAILHATAAVLVGAGLLLSGRGVTIGLIGLGVVSFVAGIVVSRRDDSDSEP